MSKFIATALVLACIATVYGQYSTDIRCASLNECICKLPAIIAAVAGRKASTNVPNAANGQTYAVDLSKRLQAITDFCNQLKQGLNPTFPFALPVDAASKFAQIRALFNQRTQGSTTSMTN